MIALRSQDTHEVASLLLNLAREEPKEASSYPVITRIGKESFRYSKSTDDLSPPLVHAGIILIFKGQMVIQSDGKTNWLDRSKQNELKAMSPAAFHAHSRQAYAQEYVLDAEKKLLTIMKKTQASAEVTFNSFHILPEDKNCQVNFKIEFRLSSHAVSKKERRFFKLTFFDHPLVTDLLVEENQRERLKKLQGPVEFEDWEKEGCWYQEWVHSLTRHPPEHSLDILSSRAEEQDELPPPHSPSPSVEQDPSALHPLLQYSSVTTQHMLEIEKTMKQVKQAIEKNNKRKRSITCLTRTCEELKEEKSALTKRFQESKTLNEEFQSLQTRCASLDQAEEKHSRLKAEMETLGQQEKIRKQMAQTLSVIKNNLTRKD